VALTLRDLADASRDVAANPSKRAKVARLADVLRAAGDEELATVTALLAGSPRQGRIGVGWALLSAAAAAIDLDASGTAVVGGTLTVLELDRLLDELIPLTGEGSVAVRTTHLAAFLRRADADEADLVRQLLLGGLRQGALEGLMVEAVAAATSTPVTAVRRALMLAGDLGDVADAARRGGADALAAVHLQVGRPLRPMLAATSPSVTSAMADLGDVSVEWKLDGARVQIHRRGPDVAIFTRNLNDVTARIPGVVALLRAMPVDAVVLDGEAISLGDEERPHAFQDTMSRFGTHDGTGGVELVARFFDCIHLDGCDLLDEPLEDRLRTLGQVVGDWRVPGTVTEDVDEAVAVLESSLDAGHEGVMVKAASSR
jgi:DNA ligase 1